MTSLWFREALLPGGWAERVRIGFAGSRIASIDVGVPPGAGDETRGAALPGLANLHSHAFQRGMSGLTELRGPTSDSFWTWRDLMYRFAARIGPDQLQAIAAMAFVEMVEAGFSDVAEFHYIHHDRDGRDYADPAEMGARLAAAAAEAGIGLTLLPVFYAASGFGGAAPRTDQRRFVNDVDGYARLLDASRAAVRGLPGGRVGVAPHSLRAVTPAALTALVELAGDGPIHIHIAEQEAEVADCIAWSGQRPVAWLFDHQPVDRRWCLVHATHVTGNEMAQIARSGAVAGLCPVTEANLGDGIFPADAFVKAGGTFGIGTDSNVAIDAAGELRLLEYGQRLMHRQRNMLAGAGASTGRTLFDAAFAGGARATASDGAGIAVGAPATIWTLDLSHPTLVGKNGDRLLDSWIFGGGRMIDSVWTFGQRRVRDGRHVARVEVEHRYRAALQTLVE